MSMCMDLQCGRKVSLIKKNTPMYGRERVNIDV